MQTERSWTEINLSNFENNLNELQEDMNDEISIIDILTTL